MVYFVSMLINGACGYLVNGPKGVAVGVIVGGLVAAYFDSKENGCH
jgi:hypothetical protein